MKPVQLNLLSSIALALMACDGDVVVSKGTSAAPTVLITSHAEGESFANGDVVVFRAEATDDNNEAAELMMAWYIDGTTVCDLAPIDTNGLQECSVTIAEGMTSIVVEVRDPDDNAGRFELAFVIDTNASPLAQIVYPNASSVFYANQSIAFEGVVSDTEDDASTLQVEWRSSLDGVIHSTSADVNGRTSGEVLLSQGTHQLELYVQDTEGAGHVDSVSIEVREPNEAPNCEFISPEDGFAGEVGEGIPFQGVVLDPNVSSDQLIVEWSSDKDGVFGDSVGGTDGVTSLLYDGLSINTHIITLHVEDDQGLTCSIQRTVTVGTAPSVVINTPQTGSVFNLGDPVSLSGTVSDSEDSPVDLNVEWSSSRDGSLFSGVASAQGETAGTTLLSAGQHQLTLQVSDTTGFSTQDTTAVYINTPPPESVVSLTPSPVFSVDDVVISITQPIDIDGDMITHSIEWLQGMNQSVTGLTGLVLPASATDVGEYWTARVTPNDGYVDGESTEVSFVVQNTAPSISNVVIAPNPVFTGSVLTCSANATDPEDGVLQPLYDWSVNGTPVGVGSTWTVSSTQAVVGDSIVCTATAQDTQMMTVSATATAVLSNSSPVISSVQITCANGAYNDQLCECTASVFDPDEVVVPVYSWSDPSGVISSTQSLDLSTTSLMPGDVLECTVETVDSVGEQAEGSDLLTVDNRPPNNPVVSIAPSNPIATIDDLTCQVSANGDPDGQSVTVISYDWTSDFGNVYSGSVVPASSVSDAETWTCEVVVSDGSMTTSGTASVQAIALSIDPVTFTTCGQTGHLGPSQSQCDGEYLGTDLEASVSVLNGAQQWMVPYTGTYIIEANGAMGGNKVSALGGSGAHVSGEFQLTAGDVLSITIGQRGTSVQSSTNNYGGGGGGGSFVFDQFGTPLIIAGGGGGASYQGNPGYGGSSTPSSLGGGYGQSSAGNGGYTDNGGGGGTGAGGGGLYSDGTSNNFCNGGMMSGGSGGTSQYPGYGGFGGGGGSYHGGGGGGGYTGGSGGTYFVGGGGAGSYNSGANPVSSPNTNAAHGFIVISQ